MKKTYPILLILSFFIQNIFGQNDYYNPHPINTSASIEYRLPTNDTTFDVKFYHIDIEIGIDSRYINGNVGYLLTSNINGLNKVILDLDDAFSIDSISFPAISYSFASNKLSIIFAKTYNIGEFFSFNVYYQGVPQLAGGYKGLRYETHDGSQPIIASLSTPYLAHTWWPCKDGERDKADSTFIDITIKDTTINNIQLIAVSNGLLDTIETIGNKKRFRWKHYYPSVPYYIMVAISNYIHFQESFYGDGYDFPLDYYVFESHLEAAKKGVVKMQDIMDFFTDKFGKYPFANEKYAMTQLGFYGGIENQTNSIVNSMGPDRLRLIVHELAHQWFADMITCGTWNHAWLNEGFASYAEALYAEHSEGINDYKNYIYTYRYFDDETLYSYDISDPFTIFRSILYTKGAYVLHMLRGILGDDIFFKALKKYATNSIFKYKHATTEGFKSICEIESGLDLNYFFDQWIYDERYPEYSYNYTFNQNNSSLEVAVHQTQSSNGWREVFKMPMQIQITFEDGTDSIVNIFNGKQLQFLSFEFNKLVNNIKLDPNDWILKKVKYDPTISVGTIELAKETIKIYPNPNKGNITIQGLSGKELVTIIITDLDGRKKRETIIKPNNQKINTIELKNLNSGIYFLHVLMKKNLITHKLIIVK